MEHEGDFAGLRHQRTLVRAVEMSFVRSANHFHNRRHVFVSESIFFCLAEKVLRGRGHRDINAQLSGGGTGVAEILGHEAEKKIHLVSAVSHPF